MRQERRGWWLCEAMIAGKGGARPFRFLLNMSLPRKRYAADYKGMPYPERDIVYPAYMPLTKAKLWLPIGVGTVFVSPIDSMDWPVLDGLDMMSEVDFSEADKAFFGGLLEL